MIVKQFYTYILIPLYLILHLQIWVIFAAVWDIGHWRDDAWGQVPGTSFWGFNFANEIRNDGIYTKPSASTVQVSEAGDYLIIATTQDQDSSNNRYNPQLRINQTAGSGDLFSSYYNWYSRSNQEDTAWTRAIWIVIWASANSRFEVQKRRGDDSITWWSVANASDLQVVRLDQTNYGLYALWGTWNAYGGTSPNAVDITSIINESDTNVIEVNTTTNTINLKWNNKKYLIAWSVSFEGAGNTRTQRIWHLEYDGVDNLATRSYCYMRNSSNKYCGLGSMDIIETSGADMTLKAEVFRWPWVWADQGWADQDGSLATDGNGQMIVLEMPESLEVFRSEDSVWLQDISTEQTLNIARDVNFTNPSSFTKLSDTQVSVTNPANIFTWANIWTARSNVDSTARQTSFASIVIDGVEQSTGRHGSYSRWNQGNADTFAMGYNPAGIFTTTGAWATLSINSSPLPGWAWWGWDRTQPGTLGFFALNLDTLAPPPQSPGWVWSNLKVWLKSNEWTSTTTNGATLATWSDQSPNRLDATAVNAPIYRNNISDNLNFYPTVEFNGTNHYMNNTGLGASSRSMFAVVIPDDTIGASVAGQVPFWVECEDGRLSSGTCGLPFWGIALWEFTSALTDEVVSYAVGSAAAYRSAQTGTASYPAGSPMIIHTNENAAWNGIDIYESWVKIDNAEANSYQFLTNTNYSLGRSMDDTYPFYFAGKIVEAINYAGRISDTERRKVESYLAYKYGTTIWNGTQDYIASDGITRMWSSSVAGSFTSNIFGIGRDENQGLRQPQSRGIGADNILTIQAVGQGTNISPNLTNISDMEFFSVSHDSGGNTWTALDSPTDFLILDRKWKAQEVGDVGNVHFDFDVGNGFFDVPDLDTGTNYYLVYDSNGNGSLSDESPIAMTNVSGSIWRASNINMDHNTLFSLASELEINSTEPVLNVNYTDNSNGVDVQSGQVLRYNLEITNTGISATGVSASLPIDSDLDAPYGITSSNCGNFTHTFSSGVLTFSNISIQSGDSCIIEYYAQVNALTPSWSSISASADVSEANEGGNNPANIDLPILDVISCGVNDVRLSFVTDNWWEDVFWSLVPDENACGVEEIANGGNPNLNCSSGGSQSAGVDDPYPDNTTIEEWPYTLIVWKQYRLHVIDDYGDGNTATAPHVLVSQNDTITDTFDVADTGWSFSFTVQQPTACTDTVAPEVTVNQAPGQDDPTVVDSATFQVIFNEAINVSTFTSSDITLSGTSGSITSGPTEVSPFNGTTFQFTVTGMTLWDTVTATIPAWGIEDLAGNLNKASSSIDNQVTYDQSDTIAPTISGTNFASGALLPGGSHTIVIDYFDADSGIDTWSTTFELYKWNGSTWGSNIVSWNIGTPTITTTQANYPTLDLDYGKYLYAFQISDNAGNSSNTGWVLYIDKPLFHVGTGEIDIGNITSFSENFSSTVTLKVETVGASFEVLMNRKNDLAYNSQSIESFDGSTGYWYRPAPLSGNIQTIATDQVVSSQASNINSNGDRNIYTYELQLWAIVEALQASGDYQGNIDFSIQFQY
mgnify:CR=1 FL=1